MLIQRKPLLISKYACCRIINRKLSKSQILSKIKLEGLVAAPVTPFTENGELDSRPVERCAKYFKKTHFNGVFVAGTMGEGLAMPCSERKKLAEKWREFTDDKLFMVLHIGTSNLKESQELARHAEDLGVDAIAALPPTYQKPRTEEQLVDYLRQVATAAPNTPLLYYDYNIATGVYLNVARSLELAEKSVPSLYGLKHTSPELSSALNCSTVCGGKYKVFFGTEALYLPALSLGIPDVITVPYFGETFHKIRQAFIAGDMKQAQELQKQAQQLVNIQARYGGGIACAKAMFELSSGIPVGPPKSPLHPIPTEKIDLLRQDLQNANLL